MTSLPFSALSARGMSFVNSETKDVEIILGDELIRAIAYEVYENHHIGTVLRILTTHSVGRGFSITLNFHGHEFKITDPVENPTLYNYWRPILPQLVTQILSYGMVVIDLVDREDYPEPYHVQPRVMDLNSEVYVKMVVNERKERRYLPYIRQRNMTGLSTQEVELKTATVHVTSPPTFDGQISSPMQQILQLCGQMQSALELHEMQNMRATITERIYWVDPKAGDSLDTDQAVSAASAARYMPASLPYGASEVSRDYRPPTAPIMKGSMQHRAIVAEATNAFQQGEHIKSQARADGTMPETMTRLYWNSQLNAWTRTREVDYFRPEKLLPKGERLEHGTQYNYRNSNFVEEYSDMLRRLTSRFGVPFEWVTGSKAMLSSEVENSMTQFDATIRDLQEKLESVLANVYLSINGHQIMDRVQDRYSSQAIKDDIDRRKTKRLNRKKERAFQSPKRLRGDPEDKGEEEARNSSDSFDEEEEEGGGEGETPVKLFLSVEDVERLKTEARVTVHFAENPTIDQETIDSFLEKGYISRESAQELAFRRSGLADIYKATPEQLENDAKLKRKLEELSTPPPETGSAPKPNLSVQ
jgi:hypothetical protein